jgi:hypothetical protein
LKRGNGCQCNHRGSGDCQRLFGMKERCRWFSEGWPLRNLILIRASAVWRDYNNKPGKSSRTALHGLFRVALIGWVYFAGVPSSQIQPESPNCSATLRRYESLSVRRIGGRGIEARRISLPWTCSIFFGIRWLLCKPLIR